LAFSTQLNPFPCSVVLAAQDPLVTRTSPSLVCYVRQEAGEEPHAVKAHPPCARSRPPQAFPSYSRGRRLYLFRPAHSPDWTEAYMLISSDSQLGLKKLHACLAGLHMVRWRPGHAALYSSSPSLQLDSVVPIWTEYLEGSLDLSLGSRLPPEFESGPSAGCGSDRRLHVLLV